MALLTVTRAFLELGSVLAVVALLGLIWLFDLDPQRSDEWISCDQ